MLALVTAKSAADLDPDLAPLHGAFAAVSMEVRTVAWDDERVDWAAFDAVILRSTWDYVDRLDEFQRWLRSTARVTRIVNSLAAIGWNIDKHYLAELSELGVSIVATSFVEVGEAVSPLARDVDVWVVKPAIGAGSSGARRCARDEVVPHVATLHAQGRAAMVQPYLDLIDSRSETSLTYIGDGDSLTFDHAFSKGAILKEVNVDLEGGLFAKEEIGQRTASSAELELGAQVLSSAPVAALGPLAYARVDIAPTPDGPVLMELELVEPSLYFNTSDGSADRCVAAWNRFLAQ